PSFFCRGLGVHPDRYSFPTRRSSDLGGWLLRYDEGPDDGGSPFAAVIQTTPLAPAGIGGEAVFDLLHVAITHSLEDEATVRIVRSEEHTSELQSRENLLCRLLLEKKK